MEIYAVMATDEYYHFTLSERAMRMVAATMFLGSYLPAEVCVDFFLEGIC